MRRRKADRIQKIARDFAGQFHRRDGESDWTDELELRVEKLLRREHRAVVRMVKSHTHNLSESDKLDEFYRGYISACEYILQDLKARAQ